MGYPFLLKIHSASQENVRRYCVQQWVPQKFPAREAIGQAGWKSVSATLADPVPP